MSVQIVTKNSATAGSAPAEDALVKGELAINVKDQKLFSKDADGNVFELADGKILADDPRYVKKAGGASAQTITGSGGLKTNGLLASDRGISVSGGSFAQISEGVLSSNNSGAAQTFLCAGGADGTLGIDSRGIAYVNSPSADATLNISSKTDSAYIGVRYIRNGSIKTDKSNEYGYYTNLPIVDGANTVDKVAGFYTGIPSDRKSGDTSIGYEHNLQISTVAGQSNFGFVGTGNAPNFYAGSTYIGGSTARNTLELWLSTLTEEQREEYDAGTYPAPANVTTPGDGSYARQWWYDQQSPENKKRIDDGELEYPSDFEAADFTDTFALGDNTNINLLSTGDGYFANSISGCGGDAEFYFRGSGGTQRAALKLNWDGDSAEAGCFYVVHKSDNNVIIDYDGNAYFAGKCGIGAEDPQELLHVQNLDTTNDKDLNYAVFSGPGGNTPGLYIGGNNTTVSTGDAARYSFINSESTNGTDRPLYFQTGGTNRICINQSGDVGVGVDDPETKFHVSDPSLARVLIKNTGDDSDYRVASIRCAFDDGSASDVLVYRPTGEPASNAFMSIRLGGTTFSNEKIRILPNGNIGIDESDPQVKLDVNGDIKSDNVTFRIAPENPDNYVTTTEEYEETIRVPVDDGVATADTVDGSSEVQYEEQTVTKTREIKTYVGPELDVKETLLGITGALEGLKAAAASASTCEELRSAIETALANI